MKQKRRDAHLAQIFTGNFEHFREFIDANYRVGVIGIFCNVFALDVIADS